MADDKSDECAATTDVARAYASHASWQAARRIRSLAKTLHANGFEADDSLDTVLLVQAANRLFEVAKTLEAPRSIEPDEPTLDESTASDRSVFAQRIDGLLRHFQPDERRELGDAIWVAIQSLPDLVDQMLDLPSPATVVRQLTALQRKLDATRVLCEKLRTRPMLDSMAEMISAEIEGYEELKQVGRRKRPSNRPLQTLAWSISRHIGVAYPNRLEDSARDQLVLNILREVGLPVPDYRDDPSGRKKYFTLDMTL